MSQHREIGAVESQWQRARVLQNVSGAPRQAGALIWVKGRPMEPGRPMGPVDSLFPTHKSTVQMFHTNILPKGGTSAHFECLGVAVPAAFVELLPEFADEVEMEPYDAE